MIIIYILSVVWLYKYELWLVSNHCRQHSSSLNSSVQILAIKQENCGHKILKVKVNFGPR